MTIAFEGSQAAADSADKYPVAPEGTIVYLNVDKAEEKKAKTGRDMMELELVVSAGEYEGRVRVWDYLTFLEATHPSHGMTLHALHAYGFETEGPRNYSAEAFMTRGVKAELTIDTYGGKRKNKIKRYLIDEDAVDRAIDAAGDAAIAAAESEPAWVGEPEPVEAARPAPAARPAAPAPAARKPAPAAAPARKLPWQKKK